MNYFPFHIGDYAAHTGHLDEIEDLAYRRLLDQYYLRESPLPGDAEKTAKLVRLRGYQKEVESVLKEFFELGSSGWSHKRCEEEIRAMRVKQDAVEERDDHEKTRQHKHRERRSAMFAKLVDVGVYPPWNAKTAELERLINEHIKAPVTAPVTSPVTAPVTSLFTNEKDVSATEPETLYVTPVTAKASEPVTPATAIPTPTPTPTPVLNKKGKPFLSPDEPVTGLEDEPDSPGVPPCPHRRLIAKYAEILPMLPKPRVELWTDSAGATAMRQRWKWVLTAVREDGTRYAETADEGIAWFARFFERVSANDFLCGRNGKWGGCDLAWLMRREKFTNVVNGFYERGEQKA